VLLERLENFLSTGVFQPDGGQAVVRAHAFFVSRCVLWCVAPNACVSVILRSWRAMRPRLRSLRGRASN
jgi:hypothetical protein